MAVVAGAAAELAGEEPACLASVLICLGEELVSLAGSADSRVQDFPHGFLDEQVQLCVCTCRAYWCCAYMLRERGDEAVGYFRDYQENKGTSQFVLSGDLDAA